MCIRDRKKDETELLKAFQERVPHYMEPNRFVRVTSTVSYPHLDVYKRQPMDLHLSPRNSYGMSYVQPTWKKLSRNCLMAVSYTHLLYGSENA